MLDWVGLLDQRAYPGIASVDLSVIEGRPLEARPARSLEKWRAVKTARMGLVNGDILTGSNGIRLARTYRENLLQRSRGGAERAGARTRCGDAEARLWQGDAIASGSFHSSTNFCQTRVRVFRET